MTLTFRGRGPFATWGPAPVDEKHHEYVNERFLSKTNQAMFVELGWVGKFLGLFFGSFEDPWTWGHEGELVSFQNAEKH